VGKRKRKNRISKRVGKKMEDIKRRKKKEESRKKKEERRKKKEERRKKKEERRKKMQKMEWRSMLSFSCFRQDGKGLSRRRRQEHNIISSSFSKSAPFCLIK
jgi:hypothetical protein